MNKVGPRAPNLSAFIEIFILSIKSEALDHFICFGREHFDYIVSECLAYYHECRSHQGIGNVLLPRSSEKPPEDSPDTLPLDLSEIKCETRLGGLLRHYYREAAWLPDVWVVLVAKDRAHIKGARGWLLPVRHFQRLSVSRWCRFPVLLFAFRFTCVNHFVLVR